MLQKVKIFPKDDVRPLLLPKQGPHTYKKERRNKRGLPRTEKQEEGARAAGGRRGPRHTG